MKRYSAQPRYWIFVKGYGYSPGVLAMRQKLLNHTKQSATDALETASKREIQKTAGATGDLISNKIPNKITEVSKSPQ